MSFYTINESIKIANCDCIDLIKDIPDDSVDMILCDPSYGIEYKTSYRKNNTHRFCSEIANDKNLDIVRNIAKDLYRVLKNDTACFMFASWKKQDEVSDILEEAGFKIKNRIIWDKGNRSAGDLKGQFGYQYEVIMFASKGRPTLKGHRFSDIWRFPRISHKKALHQNEKPVALLEQAITSFTEKDALILDPVMGAASTGIASINTGRKFIGFEIDEDYYNIAKNRLLEDVKPGDRK